MEQVSATLRIFFAEPFWVGVVERYQGNALEVSKITFGPEPKDPEVYSFVLKNYAQLEFSPALAEDAPKVSANPKRRQREARHLTANPGLGAKAQQALALQREARKTERQNHKKEQRQAAAQAKFNLKQQKRKAKHRGK